MLKGHFSAAALVRSGREIIVRNSAVFRASMPIVRTLAPIVPHVSDHRLDRLRSVLTCYV